MTTNTGHGHVIPRADGVRARCGGPAMCRICQVEAGKLYAATVTEAELDRQMAGLTGQPQEHASLDDFAAKVETGEPWRSPGLMPAFALWWADHAPTATQSEAWDEWLALQSIDDGPPYDQRAMDAAVKEAVKQEREKKPDTAPMYKALQDAYVVLCGYNSNPAWRSFASDHAARQISAILHAVPESQP